MLGIILSYYPVFLASVTILFLVPFEIFQPRISGAKNWRERVPTILAIAIFSVVFGTLFTIYLQRPIIEALKPYQIFSFAKLQFSAEIIFVVSFLFIDFLTFLFHWLSHKIDILWRLHAVHHSDEQVTAITGHLHHPFETVVTHVFMLTFYILLGVPALVVAYYIAFSAVHNIFVHADISIPQKLEKILRFLIVTPDMHRTHHSINNVEGNSNFGQMFPFWDWIFGTNVESPALGEANLKMGLFHRDQITRFSIVNALKLPFSLK
jgi:sterol desaturase/sphingolipid hydroxylase (fatty acid hydroxylase superfamily)